MRAFIFPGQGSQAVGMGKALADASAAAREVFAGSRRGARPASVPADERRARRTSCTLTENAQPAIMANAIATLRVLEKEGGIRLADKADYVAGHSLGEYTALCAAGALDLPTTARLLKLRGQAMQAAVPVGEGAMAALLGADLEKAQAIADARRREGEVCTVANDNDPSQVVISGHRGAIERAIALAKDMGAKRAVLLPVSAPFHCPLMQPAADAMEEALADARSARAAGAGLRQRHRRAGRRPRRDPPRCWSSRSPAWCAGANRCWRWRRRASTDFVEFGGKVLGPMVKRIAPDVDGDQRHDDGRHRGAGEEDCRGFTRRRGGAER